jgi:hypothetical protein
VGTADGRPRVLVADHMLQRAGRVRERALAHPHIHRRSFSLALRERSRSLAYKTYAYRANPQSSGSVMMGISHRNGNRRKAHVTGFAPVTDSTCTLAVWKDAHRAAWQQGMARYHIQQSIPESENQGSDRHNHCYSSCSDSPASGSRHERTFGSCYRVSPALFERTQRSRRSLQRFQAAIPLVIVLFRGTRVKYSGHFERSQSCDVNRASETMLETPGLGDVRNCASSCAKTNA